jgi:DEAD/DEAH box helicase domain-containing protein
VARNIVYFDLETQQSADEVGGWNNISKMRMSVGVTYNTAHGDYTIYGEGQINELITELQRADLVVGFNVLRFDYEVLHGYTPYDLTQIPTLDMLVYLQGLQAIKWFKEGKLVEIAEYCCYDVKITKLVHEHGCQQKQLHYNNRFGKKLSVPIEW